MATKHVTAPADLERGEQRCRDCGQIIVSQEEVDVLGFFMPDEEVWTGPVFTSAFELRPWTPCE